MGEKNLNSSDSHNNSSSEVSSQLKISAEDGLIIIKNILNLLSINEELEIIPTLEFILEDYSK